MLRHEHIDGGFKLGLEFESSEVRDRFLSGYCELLQDLSKTAADPQCDDALLHVSSLDSRLWIVCVHRMDGEWTGQVFARKNEAGIGAGSSPPVVTTFLAEPRETQCKEVLQFLTDEASGLGLPVSFPLLQEAELVAAGSDRRILVKVDPTASWFLFVPIEQLAILKAAKSVGWTVEWVATAKTFRTTLSERIELHKGIEDAEGLLRHTVVILNTYEKADFTAQILELTDRVESLLGLLTGVPFQIDGAEKELALRVVRNPGASELEAILRDPQTRFLLADFHTEKGQWQLGASKGSFDLNAFEEGSLSHIQLIQVFHCHSMLNPSASSFYGSAVDTLLRAGARRVEGSPFIENYVSYITRLVSFVSGHPALNFVMGIQASLKGLDLAVLLENISAKSRTTH